MNGIIFVLLIYHHIASVQDINTMIPSMSSLAIQEVLSDLIKSDFIFLEDGYYYLTIKGKNLVESL